MLVLCFKHHSKITELKLKLVAGDVVQELSEQDSEHFQRYKCLIALDFEDDWQDTNRLRIVGTYVRTAIILGQKGPAEARQVVRLA